MHGIEVRDGKAAFTYNVQNGHPWHRLGESVQGLQTIDEALERIGADFVAYKAPLTATANDGTVVDVPDKVAICADRPIGPNGSVETQVFGVLGDGYQVVQYRAAAEKAYAVVEAADNGAHIDTMGLLFDGKRFFTYILLDDLVIDPNGINDKIERGLVVYSSHDGSIAVTYALSDIRVVCNNTVTMAVAGAERIIKAKHTAKVDDRLSKQEAQRVLGISTDWAAEFTRQAEALLRVPYSDKRFDTVLKRVFPVPGNATDRQKANTAEVHGTVRQLFKSDKNSKNFGANGWTMYNSITEYLDHYRKASDQERALTTITPGSWVEKRKVLAYQAVLSTV